MSLSRRKNQSDLSDQINVLTRSAFALALSVVSLLLFRGSISIVSTFIIPVVIVLFSKRNELLSFTYIAISLLMVTVLFFQTQIIFVIGYLLLSVLLKHFLMDSAVKVKISFSGILKYLIAVIVILFIGIQLTQIIFLIPLHDMMLRLSNNLPYRYFGILLVEGIIITLVNLLLLKAITSRLKLE
ncbi:hypothetical protein [Alkalibacter saccharofermentans]|uniref:Uncharacterized protein n=1 Tax=Alkalibacter saccharofermentans DSM 14828 TaxID=1120975 RepID=A0A1M5A4W3_9FIRM|nr:hypothetical protein [Alkalibacter saccharofermentans]SHF24902.1 hypothetical protein SAMN02746064_02219 [Alkalibacter saccharofermentans DSM 14828]